MVTGVCWPQLRFPKASSINVHRRSQLTASDWVIATANRATTKMDFRSIEFKTAAIQKCGRGSTKPAWIVYSMADLGKTRQACVTILAINSTAVSAE